MSQTLSLVGSRPQIATKRATLWIVLIAALGGAVASIVYGVVGLVQTLGSGESHLVMVANKGGQLFNYNEGNVHILHGHFTYATVVVTGLPGSVVTYIVVAAVATILTEVALCGAVAVLAWRMLQHRPFRRSLTRTVGFAGLVLAIGGLLSQGATSLAGSTTASLLNRNDHTFWPVAGRFDPTWIVFGVVLLIVALAFEYGERLQNETDGLV